MSTAPMNIVVVDDEKDLCDICSEILQSQGHQVTCFYDGKSAIKNFPQFVDMIMVDNGLGDMEGTELIEKIFLDRKNKNLSLPPVLFVSGNGVQKVNLVQFPDVPLLYLGKPFEMNDILLMVEQVRNLKSNVRRSA